MEMTVRGRSEVRTRLHTGIGTESPTRRGTPKDMFQSFRVSMFESLKVCCEFDLLRVVVLFYCEVTKWSGELLVVYAKATRQIV